MRSFFLTAQPLPDCRNADSEIIDSMSDLGFHDSTQTRDKPVYYNMKPCSDGWHMLFIDAEAENVCLGLDKRDGESSEEGLSKIAAFLNPKNAETDLEKAKPTCFAAATETAWGLRVVVGYDDGSVHLFIVPSDIFQAGRGGEHSDWLQNSDASGAVKEGGSGFGAVWPVEVRGTKIGYIDDLADVAIQGEGTYFWVLGRQYRIVPLVTQLNVYARAEMLTSEFVYRWRRQGVGLLVSQ